MIIDVTRYNSQDDFTNGLVQLNREAECYSIEDELRTTKIWGETRIDDGQYEIKFKTHGGFHERYLKIFGADFHKGMLQIINVPKFSDVLVHMGNDDDDTAACLIVGSAHDFRKPNWVSDSKTAYKKMYAKVRDALLSGERVFINYQTIG